jgi:hypothetical protein
MKAIEYGFYSKFALQKLTLTIGILGAQKAKICWPSAAPER